MEPVRVEVVNPNNDRVAVDGGFYYEQAMIDGIDITLNTKAIPKIKGDGLFLSLRYMDSDVLTKALGKDEFWAQNTSQKITLNNLRGLTQNPIPYRHCESLNLYIEKQPDDAVLEVSVGATAIFTDKVRAPLLNPSQVYRLGGGIDEGVSVALCGSTSR